MKAAKASWRRHTVVRVVTETQNDYRWWRYQDTEPKEGYVVDTMTYTVPAYPLPEKPKTRNAPRTSLSRRKLRKRLYRAGFRGENLKDAFATIVGFAVDCYRLASEGDAFALAAMQGSRYPFGWSGKAIRERLGNRGWKALTKGIQPIFIALDEFGYYVTPQFQDFVQKAMTDWHQSPLVMPIKHVPLSSQSVIQAHSPDSSIS